MGHNEGVCMVYFDLQTGGLGRSRDILQIAMKYGDDEFNQYINPTENLTRMAAKLTGLSNVDGKLFLHGKRVRSYSLSKVIRDMLMYLKNFGRPCVLVAHNCFKFDAPRLIYALRNAGTLDKVDAQIIKGFGDTLPLFKKAFPGERIKLHDMASDKLTDRCAGSLEALNNVRVLEDLTKRFLSEKDILTNFRSFGTVVDRFWRNDKVASIVKTFHPMHGFISQNMMRILANAGINYKLLVSTYRRDGEQAAISLIQGKENGKPTIIKKQKILNQIIKYLQMID